MPPRGPSYPYAQPPGIPNGLQYPMPPGGYHGPNLQYGNAPPLLIPPDPRLPLGTRPSTPPQYIDGGPKRATPAEPYFVHPESPQALPKSMPETKPAPKPREVVTERLIQAIGMSEPSEPYTAYEGERYAAEMRNDNTHTWVQANFIHWWVRRDNTPPLATTGATGAIGNADTVVLVGGDSRVGPSEFSGIQATLGMWLDPDRMESLEIGGFWVGKNSRQYPFFANAGGSPSLAQPVLVGGAEAVLFNAQPGVRTGAFNVHNVMDFHGLEVNIARNILRIDCCSLDYLIGARYLYMNDNLNINQSVTTLTPGAASFNGIPQPAGSNFLFNDSFNMTNRFYGGTLGARFNYTWCRFDIGATLKVSLGATHHVAIIDGSTTLVGNGTLPGGTLAQPSNIGRVTSTDFSVVPEANATLGYRVTPCIRVLLGYNFLDWNRIQRVGNQIDRNLDAAQAPTSPAFVPGAVGAAPRFPGVRTDFWAQGINVGVELKY